MENERIKLDMNMSDIIFAMSEGNPGAIVACMELLNHGDCIDPDAWAGGFASLLELDSLNIWGSRIYMFWNDVCGRDVGKMIAVLRADQLGQLAGITTAVIQHAIDHRGDGINLDAVVAAVKARLPRFNPAARKAMV